MNHSMACRVVIFDIVRLCGRVLVPVSMSTRGVAKATLVSARRLCGELTTITPVRVVVIGVAIAASYVIRRAYLAWRRRTIIGNTWSSWYLSLMTVKRSSNVSTVTMRSHFVSLPDVANGRAPNHTHPESARVRSNGSSLMDLFSRTVGMTPYFVQQSASDVRRGRPGCRSYHWAKDLTAQPQAFAPPDDAVLCLVDVDMYVNMPELLATNFLPVLVSTFVPGSVAKSSGEYSYTFNENDEVVYKVSGGAVYQHPVWNYGVDVTMAVSWLCGIYYVNVYNVDRRRLDNDHQLILLTPIQQIRTPYWDPSWLMGSEVLRLRVATIVDAQCFLRLDTMTSDGLMRCTGKAGKYLCATISASEDDTLASMASNSKTVELTIASVKTAVKDVDQAEATILCEYHRKKTGTCPTTVYPVSCSVARYQIGQEYDPDARALLTPFMSPIMTGCYAPDRTYANEAAAVAGRVTDVAADPDIHITGRMLNYMVEFVELLIPVSGLLHPVDFETVWDKQSRPTQRRILELAGLISEPVDSAAVQSFIKGEAYGKVNYPRIISTIPGVAKYNYSRYVYAFSNVLRATPWYAFGKTPIDVADRVAQLCRNSRAAVMTDLSKFDGRVSVVLRALEKLMMMRAFHRSSHAELSELMTSQYGQRAYTRLGVKYDTGTSRASGSPETADFNSVDNAFMAYVALRRNAGVEPTPQEAWRRLGIYGGDDGITTDVNPRVYTSVCLEIGQVLEVEEVARGQVGVTFLSRQYGPDVWHGCNNSMCDIPRTLSKLHVTPSLPANVTAIAKLGEKLYSLYLTDAETPIIGEMASLFTNEYRELCPIGNPNALGLSSYASRVDKASQYPNFIAPWMREQVERTMAGFRYGAFLAWLNELSDHHSPSMWLTPPLCLEIEAVNCLPVPVSIQGQMPTSARAHSAKVEPRKYTEADLQRMARQLCRLGPNCKFGKKCRYMHTSQ